jgi:hypothetical protein
MRSDAVGFARYAVRYRWEWHGHPNTLLISYEDMLASTPDCVLKIASHLGLEPDPHQTSAIADATKANRRHTPAEGQHIRTAGVSRAELEIPRDILQEIRTIEEEWSHGFPRGE